MIIYFVSWCFIHQVLQNIGYIRDRNGITHTFYFCGSKFGRIDTYYFTFHIQKSTTTVTRVDRCICLDQVGSIRIFICLSVLVKFTVLGTYNTGCYRLSITKGITDSNHLLTNFQIIRTSDGSYLNLIQSIIRNI